MEAIYAVVITGRSRDLRLVPFPYLTRYAEQELDRLRRSDPSPPIEAYEPVAQIETIRATDRPFASHLLLRGVFSVYNDRSDYAARYFMAFSVLAGVRFACIELIPYGQMQPERMGFDLKISVMHDTSPEEARLAFARYVKSGRL